MFTADKSAPELAVAMANIVHNVALDRDSDASRFELDAAVLRNQFNVAVALAARRRNQVHSMQSRLPNELWLILWQGLELADRVSVSCVCHAWRALALESTRLWGFIDFHSNLHSGYCDCEECQDAAAIVVEKGVRGCRIPARTNLPLVELALTRSKLSPLEIWILDIPERSNKDVYRTLSISLLPHAARITGIYIVARDLDTLVILTHRLPDLLSLRTLRVTCLACKDSGTESHGASPISNAFVSPHLEELVLSPCTYWDPAGFVSHPALRIIAFTLYVADQLIPLLTASPNLDTLVLRLNHVGEDFLASSEGQGHVLPLVRRIPHVYLTALPTKLEDATVSSFAAAEQEHFVMQLCERGSPSTRTLRALAGHFNSQSDDFQSDNISISWAREREESAIELRSAQGKRREIRFLETDGRSTAQAIWDSVPAVLPRTFIADTFWWYFILEFSPFPKPMPNVTRVAFLHAEASMGCWRPSMRLSAGTSLFPALESIELCSEGEEIAISTEVLVVLVNALRSPDGPPCTLITRGIRIEGDTTELASRVNILPGADRIL
ncbi:hypothetical protein EXIGLDRAFT_830479 [Exidia glandulosa HHB12029]|uniref:F-box domain-containing protein n=1 Tax=Exidia glandulosa HHB12029 TaxID=1314781 RepID=A0A165NJK5_EXIGL|nr:hypothetical protein EXIGLDRAFT_830479 [Exidia glandulosa HHB12029]